MTVIIMRDHRDSCLAREYWACEEQQRGVRWPMGAPACSCDYFTRPTISEDIVVDIQAERDRQDDRFGGATRDDKLEPREWAGKIQRLFGELCDAGRHDDSGKADHALVQIAATAVAGLEALRRQQVHEDPSSLIADDYLL